MTLVTSLFLFFMIGCHRTDKTKTPSELLPQKWLVNYFSKVNYDNNGNISSIDTLVWGNGSDYVDFTNKPWAYMHFSNVHDTVPYNLLSTNTLLFDQDTMSIQLINETTLQYLQSHRSTQPYYDLVFYYFR